MTLKYDIELFTSYLERHTRDYLADEVNCRQIDCCTQLQELPELELKEVTALISVAGDTNVLVAFSFDWPLLRHITQSFLDVPKGDFDEEDCLDMASEFVNIVVGLCTGNIGREDGHPIVFSPPVLIQEARKIRQHKQSRVFAISLTTEHGIMDLNCIGPSEIFNQLDGAS